MEDVAGNPGMGQGGVFQPSLCVCRLTKKEDFQGPKEVEGHDTDH